MDLIAADVLFMNGVDMALDDAARRAGNQLACRPGCTACCTGAFAINALDRLRLERGMHELAANDAARAERVARRTAQWLDKYGAAFPGDRQTGELGTSEADEERFADYGDEAVCPALDPDTGRCDVYAWRPLTCRVFGPPVMNEDGLAACELCFVDADAETMLAAEMHVPHDEEARLLAELGDARQTVVAFALVGTAATRT